MLPLKLDIDRHTTHSTGLKYGHLAPNFRNLPANGNRQKFTSTVKKVKFYNSVLVEYSTEGG